MQSGDGEDAVNHFSLSLRIHGDLPPTEELIAALGVQPTNVIRNGERRTLRSGENGREQLARLVQPTDMFLVELGEWDGDERTEEMLLQIAPRVAELAPRLRQLRGPQCHVDLYMSAFRDTDQGGLVLPAEFVAAAASAGISIHISIPVF